MVETASYPSLRDRVVFVSGGGSGIGAAIVRAFCAQGARVAFVDIDTATSQALCEEIGAEDGPRPLFQHCDLRDIGQLRLAITTAVEQLGSIRVLVNNAANDDRHQIDDVTPDYWDDRMAVNLRHQFFAAQAVYRGMAAAGGGSIVNLGSVSWMLGIGGMPAYTTAKAAVAGLTRSLARDLGPHNIRVNSVVPGHTWTERQQELWMTPELEADLMRHQSLPIKVQPEDIARMVLFLAADDSAACSSQNYLVDGGWA
ncbi:MAG: SDR family oxidoreductase [Alphaproteobacteria bacterium]|nr:SDR family oxidoreductase [Alphaproteobacteria bacterium]MDP6563412.1 SDR family oxidoreductase [Alphaproteobacteria bacterium]MDP6812863.1 SDR family oxidoreductase [Alphaproteobacteria bacterium]